MNLTQTNRSRAAAALAALTAAAATAALLAGPGQALTIKSDASIISANHAKGRTLSGQGVKLLPGTNASGEAGKPVLQVREVKFGANPSATSFGELRFKKGKRSVSLTGIRFDFAAGTLVGKLGGTEMPVFKLGAPPNVNPGTGSITVQEGSLRLTADAAKALHGKLGLRKALKHKGVGRIWIGAQAEPTHAAPRPVTSGTATWGFLESWRAYVLFADPPNFGTIEVQDGATATGPLMSPATIFNFPASGGSFTAGLYGATDRVQVSTGGAVKFSKPGHCIQEIKLSNLKLSLDGPKSTLVADLTVDTDAGPPGACIDVGPPVVTPGVTFATLDPSAVTPAVSGDGKTMTWTGIRANLTAAGAEPFGGFYEAGQELDPVTVTVGLG